MTFLLFFLCACVAGSLGFLLACAFALGAKADATLDAIRARCEADIAHIVGDALAAELAGHLKRKDFGASSRKRIGDLLLRWGALRPAETMTASAPGDFVSSVTYAPPVDAAA